MSELYHGQQWLIILAWGEKHLMCGLLPGGRRRSIRLSTHDYASNATYFLTLCTHRRAPLFGSIVNGVVRLSTVGSIVRHLWTQTAEIRSGVVLDAFVIMPNHMHAIVAMPRGEKHQFPATLLRRAPESLGALVTGFKAACTSEVRRMSRRPQLRLWQRNYYERVIRDGRALDRIRRYIVANPTRWQHSHVEDTMDSRESRG